MNGMPKGFEECGQCRCWHRPVSSVCVYKLEKDADFVLDASGAVLSLPMIERVLRELDIKGSYRYVSAPVQREAYLDAGGAIKLHILKPHVGAEWVTRADYPADVLLIETEGGFGLIKALAVDNSTTAREAASADDFTLLRTNDTEKRLSRS